MHVPGNAATSRSGRTLAYLIRSTAATAAALLLASTVHAQTTSANFSLVDQSMWGGTAEAIEWSHFLGTSWDASASIGGIIGSEHTVIIPGTWFWDPVTADTRTGAVVSGGTSGRIGVEVGTRIEPGNVDVDYGVDASIVAPAPSLVRSGEAFTLGSSYAVDPNAAIHTEFSSFSAWMDLEFDMEAHIAGQACFLFAGCTRWNEELFDVSVDQELLSLNRDGSGTLQVLGMDVPGVNFGEEVAVGPVGVTLNMPNLETTGGLAGEDLASSGAMDVLKVGVDVPAVALDMALPGASCIIGCSFAGVGYTLFGSSLGPVFGLSQDFLFRATPMTTLVFDQAIRPVVHGLVGEETTSYTFALGDNAEFLYPGGAGGGVGVTPYYWLDNLLSVRTDVTLALDLYMEALALSSPIGSLGPVWSDNFRTPSVAFTVDQRTFAMDFGMIAGDAFYVTSVVPEPAMLLLLLGGLIGVGGVAARRRRRVR